MDILAVNAKLGELRNLLIDGGMEEVDVDALEIRQASSTDAKGIKTISYFGVFNFAGTKKTITMILKKNKKDFEWS